MSVLKKITLTASLCCLFALIQTPAAAQDVEKAPVNFGYSANPPARVAGEGADRETADASRELTLAEKTRRVVRQTSRDSLEPTEIYRVGVGDVLFINLEDAAARYYTVLVDGTIDYPLAGKLVTVVGLTTEEIEELLREKIRLYADPRVTVKVRDYASHRIRVEGKAKEGEHFLRREAMPLLIVRTMVGAAPEATRVVVERGKEETRVLDLSDPESDRFLVEQGDVLKFIDPTETPFVAEQFFFFGEKICDGGKKDLHPGLTLMQAVFEACGGMSERVRKVSILRKAENGRYVTLKYDLREILRGNQTDPSLEAGDMIDEDGR